MKVVAVVLLIALIIAAIIFGPLITIWALNALFPSLAIAYTFKTWLASLLLGGIFAGNRWSVSKD